jgi:flagellar motor protein MotB
MAGKGGGSWKVAYADFVTAMMAFFLVMWIGAQDVKVRQSVANYFVDPSGVSKAQKSGGIHEDPSPGQVPAEQKVANSQGTREPSGGPPGPATAAVMEWVRADPARAQYWKGQAQRCLDQAVALKDAANQSKTPEQIAKAQLGQLLSTELDKTVPKDLPEVYQRLLIKSFKEVNWDQVAGDIMGM